MSYTRDVMINNKKNKTKAINNVSFTPADKD